MKKPSWLVYLEYIPVKFILIFFRILPYPWVICIGKGLGIFIYYLLGTYRKVCEINLKIAFKDKLTNREVKEISKQTFVSMVLTYIEFISFPRFSNQTILEHTQTDTFHHFEKCKKEGKGVIVCSFHYSNWYWPAVYYGLQGGDVGVVTRPLDNVKLDREMNSILEKRGVQVLARSKSVKEGMRILKKGGVLALMVDQNAAHLPIFVPFFDVHAASMRGAVALAHKTGARVICVIDQREGRRHRMTLSEPLNLPEDEVLGMMKIYQWFEEKIKQDPKPYFWLHPRWKKRPEGESSFYKGLKV